MKKWGLVISLYYAAAVAALFWPLVWTAYVDISDHGTSAWGTFVDKFSEIFSSLWFAIPTAVVVLGQILLLVISVDTSRRRLKPRASIALPATLTGLFLSVLGAGILTSLLVAIFNDKFFEYLDKHHVMLGSYLILWPVLWVVWGVVFYFRARGKESPVARAASWVLKGSILEFLVVVPCHVIVRRRDDCCAPFATSLGMCTGLAIMLIAFGPSVWLLYRKQMESYKHASTGGHD